MSKKRKVNSYAKLKYAYHDLLEEILCLVQRPDSMDAETIRIKYRIWLENNEVFQWSEERKK